MLDLDQLNNGQRQAVTTTEGNVLVLAGAGTGKTRVLTTRIAYILQEELCRPFEILAVTFTNKAAHEMKERVLHLIGEISEGIWIGTFHSLCVRILRSNITRLDYQNNFTILDTDDQIRLLKQILKEENIDDKKYPPKILVQSISRLKDQGFLPSDFDPSKTQFDKVLFKIYSNYQTRLQILNCVDFGDLLLLTLRLFKEHQDVRERYQLQFRYILVDEYQDTNKAQHLWLSILSQYHKNLCCVGDDDQSIYGWRGAEVENILRFDKEYNDVKLVKLEENYRSTPFILACASSLIAKNENRLGKTLRSAFVAQPKEKDQSNQSPIQSIDEKHDIKKVEIRGFWNAEEELTGISDQILDQKAILGLNGMAILVRASFQTREFEDQFLRLGIPYRVIGSQRFYERQEIRDAIAYIRLLVQENDSLAFERIINVPKRGIGSTTLQKIHDISRTETISLPKAALIYAQSKGRGAAVSSILHFLSLLESWRSRLLTESHGNVVRLMLEDSGYIDFYKNDKTPESEGRLENLRELVLAIDEFHDLTEFLEHVSLVIDHNRSQNDQVITLMTVHAAKGLEFDLVFIAGFEEGIFPHSRSLNENGIKGLEEERRLAYVAITRAKKQLFITYAKNRRNFKGFQDRSFPSRFITEMDKKAFSHTKPGEKENQNKNISFEKESNELTCDSKFDSVITDNMPSVDVCELNSHPRYKTEIVSNKSSSFVKSQRVYHSQFGQGHVLDVFDDYVGVFFQKKGYKKILSLFLKAEN